MGIIMFDGIGWLVYIYLFCKYFSLDGWMINQLGWLDDMDIFIYSDWHFSAGKSGHGYHISGIYIGWTGLVIAQNLSLSLSLHIWELAGHNQCLINTPDWRLRIYIYMLHFHP